MTQDRPFTMGFKQALQYEIDYRDFEKVRELPKGIELTAIAGVWGGYSNLRCLFVTADGNRICRTVFNRLKYWVPEIERHGKEIVVGERFIVSILHGIH